MTTDRLSNVIRRKFVDYFTKKHGHTFVPSSSVVPQNDKTLSFVNAGMNQFKALFQQDLPRYETPRVCNYQKCIRVGGKLCDLDTIGHDHRHHTFFEMLGNWSFNDYGKANACEWALDFLVNELSLDMNKISVTYHSDEVNEDYETRDIWRQLGIAPNRIVANNRGDNFWTMGDTGPCGPSTEIFYPSGGRGDLLEIWNLVFMDRLKLDDGSVTPLKSKFVDTGLGLERLLSVLEGVESNYETDLFKPLIAAIERKCDSQVRPYGGTLTDDLDIHYRVLADHCRMMTVALADGVQPGRRGAMFDLRSLIKKCTLISKDKFKQAQPRLLLFDLVDETVASLADAYPELRASVSNTRRVIAFESKRLLRHLESSSSLSRDNGQQEHSKIVNDHQQGQHICDIKPRRLRNIKQALAMAAPPSPPQDAKAGELLSIAGRVINFRAYKNFYFVDLSDGSCGQHLQVIVAKRHLEKPELGAYMVCEGHLVASRGAKQSVEFKVSRLVHFGDCDPTEYPLASKSEPSKVWFRMNLHLRPRAPNFARLLRVRSEVEMAIHMIMKQMDFIRVHTPSITANDSEASSDLFTINRTKLVEQADADQGDLGDSSSAQDSDDDDDESGHPDDPQMEPARPQSGRLVSDGYFRKDVYLTSSAQLHLESLAASLSRVYTISSCFRAENCISTRHLCEFVMFEAEEANVSELGALMDRVETIVKFIVSYCRQVSEFRGDLDELLRAAPTGSEDICTKLAESSYVRMSYEEALDTLANRVRGFELATGYGCDLSRRHEQRLLEYCNQVPIFVTNYPKQLKPFYMKTNGEVAECFDLLAPVGGELCGGSLREDNLERLLASIERPQSQAHEHSELLRHNLSWYLDSRRFGSFPHGGFGLGVERLLQAMLGVRNIKDTTAFPRWVGHCQT